MSCRDSVASRRPACSVTTKNSNQKYIQNILDVGLKLPVICSWLHTMWCSSLPDHETLKLMSTPRCSLPDIVGGEDMRRRRRRRRKRYALSGLKWHKTDLTWRYSMFPVMLHCGFISSLYESYPYMSCLFFLGKCIICFSITKAFWHFFCVCKHFNWKSVF